MVSWRRLAFKSLKEGYKGRFKEPSVRPIVAKQVSAPVLSSVVQKNSLADLVDSALRSGLIETEQWGLEDGRGMES